MLLGQTSISEVWGTKGLVISVFFGDDSFGGKDVLTKRYDGYVSWFQYMMRIYILICYIKLY